MTKIVDIWRYFHLQSERVRLKSASRVHTPRFAAAAASREGARRIGAQRGDEALVGHGRPRDDFSTPEQLLLNLQTHRLNNTP